MARVCMQVTYSPLLLKALQSTTMIDIVKMIKNMYVHTLIDSTLRSSVGTYFGTLTVLLSLLSTLLQKKIFYPSEFYKHFVSVILPDILI